MGKRSAYFVFCAAQRAAAKQHCVQAADGANVSVAVVAKELGRRWEALGPEERQAFKEQAAALAAEDQTRAQLADEQPAGRVATEAQAAEEQPAGERASEAEPAEEQPAAEAQAEGAAPLAEPAGAAHVQGCSLDCACWRGGSSSVGTGAHASAGTE